MGLKESVTGYSAGSFGDYYPPLFPYKSMAFGTLFFPFLSAAGPLFVAVYGIKKVIRSLHYTYSKQCFSPPGTRTVRSDASIFP